MINSDMLADPRVAVAVKAICAATRAKTELTVLGLGEEGVVVTDGASIWKLFDRWSATVVAPDPFGVGVGTAP